MPFFAVYTLVTLGFALAASLPWYVHLYFVVINVVTYRLYALDKRRAIADEWRIPERTLILVTLLGGAVGAQFARFFTRHKTKKLKFTLAICLGLLLWWVVAMFGQGQSVKTITPAQTALGSHASHHQKHPDK